MTQDKNSLTPSKAIMSFRQMHVMQCCDACSGTMQRNGILSLLLLDNKTYIPFVRHKHSFNSVDTGHEF